MADTIYVKPTTKNGNRAILHEFDDRHPNGEAFLRGYADAERLEKENAVEVFPTGRIKDAIHAGYLVETTKTGKLKTAPAEG